MPCAGPLHINPTDIRYARIIAERVRRKEVSREDRLIERLSAHPDHAHLKGHDCFEGGPFGHGDFTEQMIGEWDDWEFSLRSCDVCGRTYLHAFLESDGMPRSGRWFMGRVQTTTRARDFSPETAMQHLANHDQLYIGGSYWGHAGKWRRVTNVFRDIYPHRVWPDDETSMRSH